MNHVRERVQQHVIILNAMHASFGPGHFRVLSLSGCFNKIAAYLSSLMRVHTYKPCTQIQSSLTRMLSHQEQLHINLTVDQDRDRLYTRTHDTCSHKPSLGLLLLLVL